MSPPFELRQIWDYNVLRRFYWSVDLSGVGLYVHLQLYSLDDHQRIMIRNYSEFYH
jgi:hypothetical protein